MRLRLMATYLGVPYQAGLGPDGTDVTLFSPGPPPEELGFVAGPGHWRKQVSVADLSALWQSRPAGDYRGEPCLVLDDLGDRLHIAYLGRDAARAAQLGYWEIDREVFEVVVARREVTGLIEERVDFPLDAATFAPPPGPDPVTGTGPEAAPAQSAAGQGGGYAGPAEAAGYPGAAGNDGAAGHDGTAAGHGGGRGHEGAAGNGQIRAYGGAEHPSRMPDRVAAWHGSPASEPWPDPPAADQSAPGPAAGVSPAGDTRAAPDPDPASGQARRRGRKPRRVPWTEPWPEREPGPEPWTEDEPWSDPWTEREPGSEPEPPPGPGRRAGRKDRISPDSVFAELLTLAAIPRTAYAVDEETPGAMCLVEADGGFEVFSRTDDARLEVHFFQDEEAAYFYLFGVLAAEAVRSGRLAPNGHHNGSGAAGAPACGEDVSKYLRDRKLPKSGSCPAIVVRPAGLTVPRSPSSPVGLLAPRCAQRALRINGPVPRGLRAGTVAYVTAPRARAGAATCEASAGPVPVAAVASLAVRDLLRGARRHGKVLAVLPHATYLEFAEAVPEPRVIAISPPDALRLPNAIIGGPWEPRAAAEAVTAECWAGEGRVVACGLDIRIVRWWDPSPVFGPVSRARLDHGCGVLARLCATAGHAPGLAGHDGPARLAACCAAGDLAGAVEAADLLVGLGPGLVPSGDSMVSGVLLALRLLGGAISGGTRAVWLADWLSAAATCYATQRTTTLAASLLHCAAAGQAAAQVSAVLLGMAGQEPLEPAAARLLAAAQGADLAWGLVAGCRAALLLSVS